MEENKFKVGDRVRVINYGHLIWESKKVSQSLFKDKEPYTEDDNVRWFDIRTDLIGKEAVITDVSSNGKYATSLFSWANSDQLESC